MTHKSQSLILFILAILLQLLVSDVSAVACCRNAAAALGGWKPIKDLKDPEVQEVAHFAITERNKQANSNLKFHRVVKGETQVVSGTNYRLLIKAKDGDISGYYEAVVLVKAWEDYKNLTSFKKVDN